MEEEQGCGESLPKLQLHVLQGNFHGGLDRSTVAGDMDPAVWSRLPEDLLEQVLLHLPSASRYRFHAVCSSWRLLLTCPSFLHRSAVVGGPDFAPDLICAYEYDCPNRLAEPAGAAAARRRISEQMSAPCYPPGWKSEEEARSLSDALGSSRRRQMKVFNVDLSFVPAKLLSKRVKSQGNGLLLCLSQGLPEVRCVINPMTRTWRELPALPLKFRERTWAEQVIVDAASPGAFNVLVMKGTGSESWNVCSYCSVAQEWRIVAGQASHGHRYFQYWPRFFIEKHIYSHDRLLGDLLIHSVDDGRLVRTVFVGFPPIPHMDCACYELPVRYLRVIFMEHQGTVYGGFLFRSGLHHFGGISQLDQSRMVWVDSVLLPDSLNDQLLRDVAKISPGFVSAEWTPFCCGTVSLVGDCICFNVHSEKFQTTLTLQHVVAFHIPSRTWRTLFPRAFYSVARQYRLFEPTSLNVHL